jgi:hypothetical protein
LHAGFIIGSFDRRRCSADGGLAIVQRWQYLGAMIQPLDQHLPTPEEIEAAHVRTGLWFWSLWAGYDWSISTAYDQWVELALRMGWIERDPLAEGETIADPALRH